MATDGADVNCPTCQQPTTDATAAWLAARLVAQQSLEGPRCWGISSDALAAFGAGVGPRPRIPGTPYEQTRSGGSWSPDEAGRCFPHDLSDLNACERTVEMAPEPARERMVPVLTEFRSYVLDGLNRHGQPAHLGRAWGRDGWVPWDATPVG